MKRFTPWLFAWTLLAAQAALADVTITRLANEGVIIDDGDARIMIDGLVVEPYALYGGLPPGLADQFSRAGGLFEGIDLALASHRHHDHNQPEFACRFLKRSEGTRMPASRQVLELMREKCRNFVISSAQLSLIDPQYGEPVVIQAEPAKISAFPLSHGTGKYASLQNIGYLVEIDGLLMLHIGDAAMDSSDFELAGIDELDLDVAFIPFWFFQPGPGMAVVERFMDAPHKLAVHIPPNEMTEVRQYLAENYPDVLVLVEPGDSVVITPSPPVTSWTSPR